MYFIGQFTVWYVLVQDDFCWNKILSLGQDIMLRIMSLSCKWFFTSISQPPIQKILYPRAYFRRWPKIRDCFKLLSMGIFKIFPRSNIFLFLFGQQFKFTRYQVFQTLLYTIQFIAIMYTQNIVHTMYILHSTHRVYRNTFCITLNWSLPKYGEVAATFRPNYQSTVQRSTFITDL